MVAEAPQIELSSSSSGGTVSEVQVAELPLNGRNFVQLTLLTAGATTVNPAGFTNGLRTTAGGRPYVNGNREVALRCYEHETRFTTRR